jgi:DnaK suppressor protein
MSVDTERFRTLLLQERGRVEDAIHNLHAETLGNLEDTSGELAASRVDNHPADTATATLDRELDLSLEENSAEVLAAIGAALLRLDDGTYGICAKCGGEIPQERLEARPWSQLCIDDQRKAERR